MPAEKLNCNLRVVTAGVSDVNPTLVLSTDTSKYFFNVGEGSQRLCAEHRIKLMKLDTIFITECTVECMGGLPGMLLTLADKVVSAYDNKKEVTTDKGKNGRSSKDRNNDNKNNNNNSNNGTNKGKSVRKSNNNNSDQSNNSKRGSPEAWNAGYAGNSRKRKASTFEQKIIHKITVHGPPGLKKLFYSMRSVFLRRDSVYFDIIEHNFVEVKQGSNHSDKDRNIQNKRKMEKEEKKDKEQDKEKEKGNNVIFKGNDGENQYKEANDEVGHIDESGLQTILHNEELTIKALVQRVPNPYGYRYSNESSINSPINQNQINNGDRKESKQKEKEFLSLKSSSKKQRRDDNSNSGDNNKANNGNNRDKVLPLYSKYKYAISYIIESAPVAGKFQVQNAIALGVPKGPLYSQLKCGKNVTLDDGRIITPNQCVDPSAPPIKVAIVACPSQDFLSFTVNEKKNDELEETSFFQVDEVNKEDSKPISATSQIMTSILSPMDCIFHLAPFHLLSSNDYYNNYVELKRGGTLKEERESKKNNQLHIYLSHAPVVHRSPFRASRLACIRLNKICPDNWRFPHQYSSNEFKEKKDTSEIQAIFGDHLMQYNIAPYHTRGLVSTTASVTGNGYKTQATAGPHGYKSLTDISQEEVDAVEREVQEAWQNYRDKQKIYNLDNGVDNKQVASSISESKSKLTSTSSDGLGLSDCKLTFFGTGCAIPSKLRNVTGIFLEVPNRSLGRDTNEKEIEIEGDRNEREISEQGKRSHPLKSAILMDAGEGTFGQMCNIFGVNNETKNDLNEMDELSEKLKIMSLIWISHPHADHHLGVLRILKEREKVLKTFLSRRRKKNKNGEEGEAWGTLSPLVIIAPERLLTWFSSYAHVDNEIDIGNREKYLLHDIQHLLSNEIKIILRSSIGLENLHSFRVRHCEDAYGVSLYLQNIGKIVFSGDTAPCPQVITNGQNADLLIHEATFDDSKRIEAADKGHSTISQAIEAGMKMKAKGIILTHFSQRYPNFPNFFATEDRRKSNKAEKMDAVEGNQSIHNNGDRNKNGSESNSYQNNNSISEYGERNDPFTYGIDEVTSDPPSGERIPVVVAFDRMEMKLTDMQHLSSKTGIMHHLFPMMEEDDD